MLCARFVWGAKSHQNQNNMSLAPLSYETDKKEHNNMFFPINKQTKFAILTFRYPKQSARTALWDLVKIVDTKLSSYPALSLIFT